MLDERFTRPEPFDLEAYWSENTRRLEAELHPHEMSVRLSPRGMRMMESILPAYVRCNAVLGAADADGWHAATMPAATPDHAVSDLLRFGTEIEVLGPPELRAHMAATVRRLADTYGELANLLA